MPAHRLGACHPTGEARSVHSACTVCARGAVIIPSAPAVVSKPALMPRLEVNLRSKRLGRSCQWDNPRPRAYLVVHMEK